MNLVYLSIIFIVALKVFGFTTMSSTVIAAIILVSLSISFITYLTERIRE